MTAPSPQLIVFLENGGHVEGLALPPWASRLMDWAVEEYAKAVIWLHARRHYAAIVVLEDRRATAAALWEALVAAEDAVVDLLMLVHGQEGYACGHGRSAVGADFFEGLRLLRAAGAARFRLRAVYQMNCYGASLAPAWLSLGAQAVNGAEGINWLPEPSLSVFLRRWLAGRPFGEAIADSYRVASRLLGLVWRGQGDRPHPKIASSRMQVFGDRKLCAGQGSQVAFS
ncbi:MAG: hypothetical protein NZ528_13415 [Caldilineales bacterium]|nr:hypothetical protein [Caldilineales bacterium]MDW8317548.1 hypothetical protein [Anaerolineae bacterium]